MIDEAELEPRCDQCRKHVEPEALETVLRYYCRDCAAAHDIDVPLSKAHLDLIKAELRSRSCWVPTAEEAQIVEAVIFEEDERRMLAKVNDALAAYRGKLLDQRPRLFFRITPAEKDILDAAKGLACKPVRRIVDDRQDSEDRGASVPAQTGSMIFGSRAAIHRVCEAVIRWRASVEAQQDSGPGADRQRADPPLGAGPGLTSMELPDPERCSACGAIIWERHRGTP